MTQQLTNIDMDRLRLLYKANPVAKALLDYWGSRKYNQTESAANRLVALLDKLGVSGTYREVVDFLKSLEDVGCGRFLRGRKGHPTRLEWHVRMQSVGWAAAGKKETVERISVGESAEEAGEEITRAAPSVDMMIVKYPLRPELDVLVEVTMPKLITEREAQRLADFIRTLATHHENSPG
jgi:hypothetical protein